MKVAYFGVILTVVFSGCATKPDLRTNVADLESGTHQVIGALGKPLGTVVMVEAVVVQVPEIRLTFGSGFGRQYGLRVEKVDGIVLTQPVVLRFGVERSGPLVKLASSDADMDVLVAMLERGEYIVGGSGGFSSGPALNQEDAAKVREGYLGSRHTLYAFEDGYFFGAPHGLDLDEYGYIFSYPHSYRFFPRLKVFAPAPSGQTGGQPPTNN